MFQTEVEPEAGSLSLILQQFVAPMPLLGWGIIFDVFFSPWIPTVKSDFFAIAFLAVPSWILSFFLARLIRKFFPASAATGFWVWVFRRRFCYLGSFRSF